MQSPMGCKDRRVNASSVNLRIEFKKWKVDRGTAEVAP